jgi:endo-1,4-beta-xylanase
MHVTISSRQTTCALASLAFAALMGGCGGAPAVPATVASTPAATPTTVPTTGPTSVPTAAATPSANGEQLRDLAARRRFYVGAAVSIDALRSEPAYAELLARTYNQVTPENVMKFGPIHPARDRFNWNDADALVAFAEEHGMRVHGHTLVWHQQLPSWVTQGNMTADQARAALQDHITQVVGRYKGRIAEWDVVNEAFTDDGSPRQTVWRKLIGPEYIELAFRWAHQADPDAKLFYNDYNGEELNAKSNAIYELVRDLKQRGVPIDGVGMQMHITLAGRPDTKRLAENMRRLGDLGLAVHVSEMDVRLPTPADAAALRTQARAYREVLQVCLAAPNCGEFTTWGFTDKHSWVPGFYSGYGAALPFDELYAPKPAYTALIEELSK